MKRFKKAILLTGASLICNICLAQNGTKEDYQKFVRNFSFAINYPVELMRNCTPIACLIKVQVDSEKNVIDMKLSDSADSLLNLEFKRNKHSLDTKLLGQYLKNEYANINCTTYLIPFSYSLLTQMPCPPQNIPIATLWSYSKFNGEYLRGEVVFLNPINLQTGVQR